jgi:WD40 repeat protein
MKLKLIIISMFLLVIVVVIGCRPITNSSKTELSITSVVASPSFIPTSTQIPAKATSSKIISPTATISINHPLVLDHGVQYLVYARNEPMAGTGDYPVYSLWAVTPSGGKLGPIFIGSGPETRISPDCSFMTFFPELETTVSLDPPVKLDLNSGDISNLDNVQGFVSMDWSPNGKRITIDEDENIWILDIISGVKAPLLVCNGNTDPTFPSDCYFPAWEPEGSRIAYYAAFLNSSEADKLNGVYLVNADCSTEDIGCVSEGPLPISEVFAWSPNGKKIAFTEFQSIKVFDLMRNEVTREFKVSSNVTTPYINSVVWAPDSTSLTFSVDYEMYRLDLSTGEQQVFSTPDFDQDGVPWPREALFWEYGACLEKISKFSR